MADLPNKYQRPETRAMNLPDNLIDLRILLEYLCDGFSKDDGSKDTILSTKIKILFALENKDAIPCDLTSELSIAKSNLANTLKSMTQENLVVSYKNLNSTKNVYYQITDKGRAVLKEYKEKITQNALDKCSSLTNVSDKLDQIIQIIKECKK